MDKATALVDGVVELGIGVGVLMAADKQFKPIHDILAAGLQLGQGAVFDGIIGDEGGLDELFFHKSVKKLGQNLALAGGFVFKLHTQFLGNGTGFFIAAAAVNILAGVLLYRLVHG